jgi:GNAT superfamily N-acetyltransferase
LPAINAVINSAAAKYRGVIPDDCWHEPYMSMSELVEEMARGVSLFGWEQEAELVGVIGLQEVSDVTLIRHAYVRPQHQGKGIGGALLRHLEQRATQKLLIGTWADATWAIRFYESHGFRVADPNETAHLLTTYWNIPARQRETSVVLSRLED